MENPTNLDSCQTLKEAITLAHQDAKSIADSMTEKSDLTNDENNMRIDASDVIRFLDKLSDLLIKPEQVKFTENLNRNFANILKLIYSRKVPDAELKDQARDLAIKVIQLQYRRELAKLDKGKENKRHNYK